MALPDAPYARGTDAERGRHGARTPVSRGGWPLLCCHADHLRFDRASLHGRRSPPARRVLLNPGRSLLGKPPPPEPDRLLSDPEIRGDGRVQPAVGGSEHDPGSSHEADWGATASGPLPEERPFVIRQRDGRSNSWHVGIGTCLI